MRLGMTPASTAMEPPNPATGIRPRDTPNYITGSGVGSNQYMSMPPWMNSSPGASMPGGGLGPQNSPSYGGAGSGTFTPPGGYGTVGGFNPNPVNPLTGTVNPTQAQIDAHLPPGTPTWNPPGGGAPIPLMQPFMQSPQYMGSFAAGGTIGPVYGGSPIPAGGVNIPGGSIGPGYYGPGGAGYGVAVPPSGAGIPPPGGPVYSGAGGGPIQGGGPFSVEQPAAPGLRTQLISELSGQIGKGVPPFNLPTQLPFGLGTTLPGQLNAPTDPILQQLHNFYGGQSANIPGANTLATIANQGISALPEWQATVAAEGQNIAQNEAQLREQSAYGGGGPGSSMDTALSNYLQGATAQQNAMLAQMQQQNILQGQIPVAEGLLSGAQGFGQYAQALAQQNIQNQYSEFLRTQPQNNPWLQYAYGLSTTWDPTLTRPGSGSVLAGILGSLPNFNVGGTAQTA